MRFLSEHDGLGDHVNAADDDGALNLDARPQSLELLRYLDVNEKSGDILNDFTGIHRYLCDDNVLALKSA